MPLYWHRQPYREEQQKAQLQPARQKNALTFWTNRATTNDYITKESEFIKIMFIFAFVSTL